MVDVPPTWRCAALAVTFMISTFGKFGKIETGTGCASTDLDAVNGCNLCRNFGLFSSSMYLTWCHCILSCTFALVSFTRLLQCSRWSSQTSDFTCIGTAENASFALQVKRRCCGDVRFNFEVSSGMTGAAAATACCFHSVPLVSYPTLAAPAGSLNLRCLNCVFVSYVCSGVLLSLPVRFHPTQAIERCFESILNCDLCFVQR